MKGLIRFLGILVLMAALALPAGPVSAAYTNTTFFYDDVTLTGGVDNGHFPNIWDVSACPLTLTGRVDLTGLSAGWNTFANVQLGVRTVGYSDFSPDGQGVWIHFDHATGPGAVHSVALTITGGSAVVSIDGAAQPAVPLQGDPAQMQVFYGLDGYYAQHTVVLSALQVSGCLVLENGTVNGGGAFYAEDSGGPGNVIPGGRGSFAFLAKRKDNANTGHIKFVYELNDIRLESASFDWVTVSDTQGIFEGTGELNGAGGYKFRVRAVDGNRTGTTDRFEIRIWTAGSSFDAPTYRAEGYLAQGQIVVHKK